MVKDDAIDGEYGGGGGGGGVVPPATPTTPSNTWFAGRLVNPGEVGMPTVENGFYYVATQAAAAYTGGAEPAWPVTPLGTVVDGGVTWTAYASTSVTWTAFATYKSGGTEPAWPAAYGATVVDNGITWTAKTNAISDPYCPHTRTAIKMASKVFAPYRDVLRFCATDDPTDWTTPDDAGFLPVGMHSTQSPEPKVLGEFRGRLVILTGSHLILWTVDPDPAEMALYDALPGLGSVYPHAAVSVGNDLYYMTKQGVRSLSISASTKSIAGDDVGTGIDPLVVAKLSGPDEPTAAYFPGNGQAWFAFGNEVFVYTKSSSGKVGAWSRYVFPFTVSHMLQFRGELVLRNPAGDFFRLDDAYTHDDGVEFDGVVWTPYLDLGSPGRDKALEAVEMVGYGTCALQVGYDQTDTSKYTDPVSIGPDTFPGPGGVPIPVTAPSLAFKLTFPGGQAWQLNLMQAWLEDT